MKIGRMNKPTQLTVIQHETSTDEEVIEVKMAMSRLKQIWRAHQRSQRVTENRAEMESRDSLQGGWCTPARKASYSAWILI